MAKVIMTDGNEKIELEGRCAMVIVFDPEEIGGDAGVVMIGKTDRGRDIVGAGGCLGSLIKATFDDPIQQAIAFVRATEKMKSALQREGSTKVRQKEIRPVSEGGEA